jgi:hypothetical protein
MSLNTHLFNKNVWPAWYQRRKLLLAGPHGPCEDDCRLVTAGCSRESTQACSLPTLILSESHSTLRGLQPVTLKSDVLF